MSAIDVLLEHLRALDHIYVGVAVEVAGEPLPEMARARIAGYRQAIIDIEEWACLNKEKDET